MGHSGALARAGTDGLDELWACVNEMDILALTERLTQTWERLLATGTEESSWRWTDPAAPLVATTHTFAARAINNSIDTLYAKALADLFRKPKDLDTVITMLSCARSTGTCSTPRTAS